MARLDRKPAEHVALAAVFVQLAAGILALVFWRHSNCSSAGIFMWQAFLTVPVSIASLMHLRASRLAEEEQEDWDRLQAERSAAGARGRLFEEDEIQAFSARNRLRIFEKYVAPAVSLLLVLAVVGVIAGTLVMGSIGALVMTPNSQILILSMASFVGAAFVIFLVAMYAAGLSRQKEWRAMRAVAGYMMLSVLFSVAVIVAFAFGLTKYVDVVDDLVAYVQLGILAIVAVEVFLNFMLDFYRPRLEGVEARAAFDSRLLGLISQPGGLLRTVSSTLDYQFGFKVSQTWFYRFIEQAIAPLILFDLLTLYLLTCLVIVGPDQQGVVERFGKWNRTIEPGLRCKWPWPFEQSFRFPANEIKTVHLGYDVKQEAEKKGENADNPAQRLLWTEKHYEKEYNTVVASKEGVTGKDEVPVVNLLVAVSTVRYRIADVKKWYYSCAEPETTLEAVCSREQVKYMAGVDLLDVMGPKRDAAAKRLKEVMQEAADSADLGVLITGVGLEETHPPVEANLPQAFQELVSNQMQKEVDKFSAEAAAIVMKSDAQMLAEESILRARGYYAERKETAAGEADRSRTQGMNYYDDPDMRRLFETFELMSAMEKGLGDARKYILAVKDLDRESIRLDLQDPTKLAVTDISFNKPVSEPSK